MSERMESRLGTQIAGGGNAGALARNARGIAAAILVLGLGSALWLIEPALTGAQPEGPRRTPAQVRHELFVLGSIAGMLGKYVDLAERFAHRMHLEKTAEEARAILPMTLATDPYLPGEIAQISHAQREIESYLAVQPRTPEVLARHYKDIRKAVRDLNQALKSIRRERGGRR